MNDFKRLNEISSENKKWLNSLYDEVSSDLVKKGLEICGFSGESSQKIAVLRRIVDLKVDPLLQELKKLNLNEAEILKIRDKMFEFTAEIHENLHEYLIKKVENEKILDKFHIDILKGMHKIGQILTKTQQKWQNQIIDCANKNFEQNFASIAEAKAFINQNELYQKTSHNEICDRSYGAVIAENETENFLERKFKFVPYAVAFEAEFKELEKVFEILISKLKKTAENNENKAFIKYFEKLKLAFCEKDNDKVISAWREAEIAWMDIKSPLQIGHPLEYYEDAYTHAVALEWDIRLARATEFDAERFKDEIKESFEKIYEKIDANNEIMKYLVLSNIDKTQLYISSPMIYYAADFNGLFSAQVVPNDEFVSSNCGKKIFAFVDFVYESAKAKPFMKLSSEIFDLKYLNFGREILFRHPEIWRKVYEISTIGHEFGHIFFIDEDTENLMNKSGVFKFIEEYKATTGGLLNFFLHEKSEFALPVFDELIRRSVGLIAWQKVDEVRAYYCEGLVHLSLLFKCGALGFNGEKLVVDLSKKAYENFKELCVATYEILAKIYSQKMDANEFLSRFCVFENGIYLPLDKNTRKFVEFYHSRFEEIGNEIDESNELEKWKK